MTRCFRVWRQYVDHRIDDQEIVQAVLHSIVYYQHINILLIVYCTAT